MLSRRSFTKTLAALGGMVLMPFDLLGRWGATVADVSPPSQGELYAGFLLLPEDAPVPGFVQDYRYGVPTMCGVSDGDRHGHADAVYIELATVKDLATQGRFPAYTFAQMPPGLRPSGTSLIKHSTGELYGGWITFEAFDEKAKTWYTATSILVQADFPRPVPLWFHKSVETDGPAIILDKVNWPVIKRGILVRHRAGFTLHWMQFGFCYTLNVEHQLGAEPEAFASALTPVV